MRGIEIRSFGGPSVLELVELEAPRAEAGKVLIDVDAAGVNFGDLLVRQGAYFGGAALPVVPGWEVVGRVVDPGGSGFAAGDRVAALLDGGGYAEQVAAPAKDTVLVPEDVPDHVALAFVIQGATAWRLLDTPSPVTDVDTVLISGAGSGVTHLCVQLARVRGVERVVVLSSNEEKARVVQRLGAETVVVDEADVSGAVEARLGAGSVDHVIDMVGGATLDAMLRCLRRGGRAVVYGVAGGTVASVNTGALLRHGLTIGGLWLGHEPDGSFSTTLARLFALYRDGEVVPTTGPELPLAEAARAHELVAARTGVGKVALTCR